MERPSIKVDLSSLRDEIMRKWKEKEDTNGVDESMCESEKFHQHYIDDEPG